MKIVIFLKQVPDNTKLQFTENGPVIEGAPMMMNPYDEYALETALRLKEAAGGDSTVTVVSMGAQSAREIIKKAIAVGADQAFLLSDDAFKNGDSTANARVLVSAVRTVTPDFDVLLFGQQSLDEAAGQTGPKVAELMDLPSLTFCKDAEVSGNSLKVTRETERGAEVHELSLPGVLCMMKCDYELRSSNIKGVMKANKTEIPIKSAGDLGIDTSQVGESGSPTRVQKTWKRPAKSGGKTIEGAEPKAAVSELLNYLKDSKIL